MPKPPPRHRQSKSGNANPERRIKPGATHPGARPKGSKARAEEQPRSGKKPDYRAKSIPSAKPAHKSPQRAAATGWDPVGPGRVDFSDKPETVIMDPSRRQRTKRSQPTAAQGNRPEGYKPAFKPTLRPVSKAQGHRPNPTTSEPPRDAKKYGHLLYGLHAVREAWLNPARQCRQLWLNGAMQGEFAATLSLAEERELQRPSPLPADKTLLDQMLPGAVHQGIVLDTAPLPETSLETLLAQQPRLLVVLDQVTDPHNVGAIMRSAAAFGATGIILTERHAPSMTGTLAKTASGALEHIALVHVVNLARALDQLRDAGFWCVGLAEEGARELGQLDLSGPTALVLGAEGEGLRRLTRERCDELARLPTQGAIGSLNVSNAAAVALYEAQRQK